MTPSPSVGTRRLRRRARTCGVLAVLLLAAPACSDDDLAEDPVIADEPSGDDGPEAQPTPGETGFERGLFDELPRFRSGEEVGPVSEKDGVITQSYVADNARPHDVIDFYRDGLVGWTESGAVEVLGEGALRQTWTRDGVRLQVSAAAIDAAQGTDQDVPQVQYSLLLGEPQ